MQYSKKFEILIHLSMLLRHEILEILLTIVKGCDPKIAREHSVSFLWIRNAVQIHPNYISIDLSPKFVEKLRD